MRVTQKRINTFQKKVLDFYEKHGRKDLPWRKNISPYSITVSEIMLQQTQVERVIPYFKKWMRVFPSWRALALAQARDVFLLWSGLGYNRRAQALHTIARTISFEHSGRLPRNEKALRALSGIGQYTARAIMCFASNTPSIFIETNIRTVFIHEFFKDKDMVADSELYPFIEKSIVKENPRLWYWALMDYGAMLKKEYNFSRKSSAYKKQSPFKGSLREVRGAIIKYITQNGATNEQLFFEMLPFEKTKIQAALAGLLNDGLLRKEGGDIAFFGNSFTDIDK